MSSRTISKRRSSALRGGSFYSIDDSGGNKIIKTHFDAWHSRYLNSEAIMPIQLELEMHLRLVARALVDTNRLKKNARLRAALEEVMQKQFREMNKKYVNAERMALNEIVRRNVMTGTNHCQNPLYRGPRVHLNGQTKLRNTAEFVKKLEKIRLRLCEEFETKMITELCDRHMIQKNSEKALEKRLKKTTADEMDHKIIDGRSVIEVYTTTGTAHNKRIGVSTSINDCYNAAGAVFVRESRQDQIRSDCYVIVPSLAVVAAEGLKNIEKERDVARKINGIAIRSFGRRRSPLYYDLLTFNGHLLKDNNDQYYSCKLIVGGVHRYNKKMLFSKAGGSRLWVMLNNISNNGWGPSGNDRFLWGIQKEAFAMATFSAVTLMNECVDRGFLMDTGGSIQRTGAVFNRAYNDFLKSYPRGGRLFYKTEAYKRALDCYHLMRSKTTIMSSSSCTKSLIAKALLKLVKQGCLLDKRRGSLVQSLSLALQKHKMVGCKSANERTKMAVARKNVLLSGKVNASLRDFLQSSLSDQTSVVDLESAMAKQYNRKLSRASIGSTFKTYNDMGQDSKIDTKRKLIGCATYNPIYRISSFFHNLNTNKVESHHLTSLLKPVAKKQSHNKKLLAFISSRLYRRSLLSHRKDGILRFWKMLKVRMSRDSVKISQYRTLRSIKKRLHVCHVSASACQQLKEEFHAAISDVIKGIKIRYVNKIQQLNMTSKRKPRASYKAKLARVVYLEKLIGSGAKDMQKYYKTMKEIERDQRDESLRFQPGARKASENSILIGDLCQVIRKFKELNAKEVLNSCYFMNPLFARKLQTRKEALFNHGVNRTGRPSN